MPEKSFIELPWEEFVKITMLHMPGSSTFNYGKPELYTIYRGDDRIPCDPPTIVRIPINPDDE